MGDLPVALVAEHGVWLRPKGGEWRMLKTITTDWKDAGAPDSPALCGSFAGGVAGGKGVFAGVALPPGRSGAGLACAPRSCWTIWPTYTRNIDVQVLEGNKVIEVRNTGVTKGTAAMEWLAGQAADFILAIGDDWTDEDLFRALPPTAFSVRVGLANTAARYHLSNHTAVRRAAPRVGAELTSRERTGGAISARAASCESLGLCAMSLQP